MTILSFVTANVKIVMKRWWIKTAIKSSIFILGIILGFLVMFYGIISNNNVLIGIGIIVMGIDVVLLAIYNSRNNKFSRI